MRRANQVNARQLFRAHWPSIISAVYVWLLKANSNGQGVMKPQKIPWLTAALHMEKGMHRANQANSGELFSGWLARVCVVALQRPTHIPKAGLKSCGFRTITTTNHTSLPPPPNSKPTVTCICTYIKLCVEHRRENRCIKLQLPSCRSCCY